MFFIITSGQKQKKFNFDQIMICKNCGQYGHIEIIVTYSYLSFFFIPLLKWNKRYYASMSCCEAVCEISKELGKQIEKGVVTRIEEDILHFDQYNNDIKRCRNCGYETIEDFDYCPKCGMKF